MANKDKLLESAQKFLAKGQLPKAIGEYQKLIEAFPKDFRNRQKLAELLTREKRHGEARPHYQAVARNFTETGFYLKAIAIYKQMQKAEPERSEFYLCLAELYAKQGLIGNALNEYRTLLAYHDRHRQSAEALGVLHKMVALDPGNAGVRGQLIEKLAAQGGQGEAREQFLAMIALLDDRGEYAGIVRFFDKFGTLCPEGFEHRLVYAKALLLSGEGGRALPLLKKFHHEASDHPLLLSLLSDCHLALGHYAEACAACRQLLATDPANLGLRERYLRLCIETGDARQALASLSAWRADFIGAERYGVFRELCAAVQAAWPDDAGLQADLAALLASPPPAEGHAGQAAATAATEAPPPAAPVQEAADEILAAMELEFELDAFEVEPPSLSPPDRKATGAAAIPPAVDMVLPEFCELDFDLELTEEDVEPPADDAVPDAAANGFVALHSLFEDAAAARAVTEPAAGAVAPIVEGGVVDEDAQSHFDLGIAFKEMGLIEEAIGEFSQASRDPSRLVDSLTLMAQCRAQLGEAAMAEAIFKEALAQPQLAEEARIALRYELGLLYEAAGRALEALENFQFVADRDRGFREASGKLAQLRRSLGLDEPGDVPPAGRRSRDRISYV